MDDLVLWFRKHDSLSHIAMGCVIGAVDMVILSPLYLLGYFSLSLIAFMSCTFVIGFYYGRERRDHEIESGKTQYQLVWQGWAPWTWKKADNQQDFYYPLAFFGAVAIALLIWGK